MIRGYFHNDRPFVRAWVRLPGLGLMDEIRFLVDTGATYTTLHPLDGRNMGVPFLQLGGPVRAVRGVGGRADYVGQPAELLFLDHEGGYARLEIEMNVARLTRGLEGLPSLLGRDVLRQWRMDYDPRQNRLDFHT